jgi:hypothetical protein
MSKCGQAGTHRWRKLNRPPVDQPWVWFTREMMESPSWRAMTNPAMQVLSRVLIEHCSHGGTENGQLTVTYHDFDAYGIRRRSIPQGIAIAVGLGWLDVTRQGYAFGTLKVGSEFAVTFMPRSNGAPASNRWKSIKEDQAPRIVKAIVEKHKPHYRKRANERQRAKEAFDTAWGEGNRAKPTPRQDIERRGESAPSRVLKK